MKNTVYSTCKVICLFLCGILSIYFCIRARSSGVSWHAYSVEVYPTYLILAIPLFLVFSWKFSVKKKISYAILIFLFAELSCSAEEFYFREYAQPNEPTRRFLDTSCWVAYDAQKGLYGGWYTPHGNCIR